MVGGEESWEGAAAREGRGACARREGRREERKRAGAAGEKGKDGERTKRTEGGREQEQGEEPEMYPLDRVPCGNLAVSGCGASGSAWFSCELHAPFWPLRACIYNVELRWCRT